MTAIAVTQDPVHDAAQSTAQASALHSAVYVGSVRHRRFDAVRHEFAVGLYMVYLDLAELERAFAGRWLWSTRRFAPMRFRRGDYFGPAEVPLDRAVRDAVEKELGVRPDGAVRLLTNLRCFGYQFNPVSFYYCFDRDERLVAVLAQITNTPWGERHHYVVGAAPAGAAAGAPAGGAAAAPGPLRARFAKAFHVSPFQPMEQTYDWTVTVPGEQLLVHMENLAGGACAFDATLVMRRRPWTTGTLARTLLRHPFMTAKVITGIYWHALRLWQKRATFHTHPAKRSR